MYTFPEFCHSVDTLILNEKAKSPKKKKKKKGRKKKRVKTTINDWEGRKDSLL
jgi:hypothetical protein